MALLTKKNIFIFFILININFISSDENKCNTIEHCLKCPQSDKCDECEEGYILNNEHTKCDSKDNTNSKPSTSSSKKSSQASASAKKSSPPVASSPKKSSQNQNQNQNQNTPNNSSAKKSSSNSQNKPSASSSPKKSSQNNANNSNNNPPAASNPPVASNSPHASNQSLLSAFNITKRLGKDSTNIGIKIVIFFVITVLIVLCVRFLLKRKKKTRIGYFYDESGNPDEKAKVVIIN